jgi:hypothetical protein
VQAVADDIVEGTVQVQLPVRVLLAVVVNEAQLAELIQKETDTGALNPAGIDIEK